MADAKALSALEGITLERSTLPQDRDLEGFFRDTVDTAAGLAKSNFAGSSWNTRSLKMAFQASLQAANAMIAAQGGRCDLKTPHEDIELTVDSGGDLVYRCFHNPPHEWRLDGTRKP